jgi:hypothetical protein
VPGITIDDFPSSAGLNVTVDVDAGSGLSLHLINANPKAGSLTIAAFAPPGVAASFNPQPPATASGTETVSFFAPAIPHPPQRPAPAFGRTSTVSYTGFDQITLEP